MTVLDRMAGLFGRRAPAKPAPVIDTDWLVRQMADEVAALEPPPPEPVVQDQHEPRSGDGVLGVHGVWKSYK
ncbi:hypothetical protein, partial [Klebsiella pneumoniae]|uniref:hypothetical protein n=1 Tax=Klebsiella pneumoniae TaxID=573 RepID=UPI0013D2B8E9